MLDEYKGRVYPHTEKGSMEKGQLVWEVTEKRQASDLFQSWNLVQKVMESIKPCPAFPL